MSMDSSSEDKQRLLQVVRKLLDTDHELDFLLQLTKEELEQLTAAIRARTDGR
jgi:hypothetical protein